MSVFWMSLPTIAEVYGPDYRAFALFGPVHLGWLALCALLCVVLGRFYHRADATVRRRTLWVLTGLMLADEIFKYIATAATGQWSWIYLPLHLCSINLFVCLANTIHPRDVLKEILYALCLPGAALALLSPSWQSAPLWNMMHLHSASIHIMLFLYPVLLVAGGFRPNPRRLPWVVAFLLCTALPIYFINHRLNTNFYFLNGANNAALTRALAGIFGQRTYLLGFVVLLVLIFAVLYLPWVVAAHLASRDNHPQK